MNDFWKTAKRQLLHRIASSSAGGMDTLPHNGAVIRLLVIWGLTHKKSYPDIFAISLMTTFIALIMVVIVTLFPFIKSQV